LGRVEGTDRLARLRKEETAIQVLVRPTDASQVESCRVEICDHTFVAINYVLDLYIFIIDVALRPNCHSSLPFPQTVDVWWLSFDSLRHVYSVLLEYLCEEERVRAGRFLLEGDQRRFVVFRAGLRSVLGGYLDQRPAEVDLCTTVFGKPRLVHPVLEFNLSHSGDWGVVGVARRPVGIDVEQVRRFPDLVSLAEHFFSPEEQRLLAAVGHCEKAKVFYRCWCRKEAYVKAIGKGLSLETSSFSISMGACPAVINSGLCRPETRRWTVADLKGPAGYAAAIAVEGALQRVLEHQYLGPTSGV
jgi:4'-phosphopantetheinyl transferase